MNGKLFTLISLALWGLAFGNLAQGDYPSFFGFGVVFLVLAWLDETIGELRHEVEQEKETTRWYVRKFCGDPERFAEPRARKHLTLVKR